MKEKFLLNAKFIDYQNKEFELKDINDKIELKQAYSAFNILYRPLIDIINNSESYVLFDYSKGRNTIFQIKNITQDVRDKAEKFGYKL